MKIGLLPLYIQLYEECAPAYHDPAQQAVEKAADALRKCGFEVESTSLCHVEPEIAAAVRNFEASGCQVLVTLHAAYSPSLEAIEKLVKTELPIVVFDTTPDAEFGFDFGGKLMLNHGIHGVQDMCNMLLKRKKRFLIRAGHIGDAEFMARMRQAVLSAGAAYKTTHARVGDVGGIFAGMGDFQIPDGTFGMTRINYADSPDYVPSDAEIEAEVTLDRQNFTFAPDLPEDTHRLTVRNGLRLRKWIEAEKLDAFTVNFLGCGPEIGFENVPFPECSKAMARGVGYAGEGDMLTALFCGVLMQSNPATTFSEMFCPDWTGNRIFLSHMGEMNLALMDRKPYLAPRKWKFGKGKDIAAATGCLRSGNALLANLAPGADGKFTLIAAQVALTAQHDADLTDMRGWMTPPENMPVAEFLEAYSRLGGTHHLVLSYDGDVQLVADLAHLMGWDFRKIPA
jgi:L-arabinose isomerase